MKTAIYIEDGVIQLVLTPENEFEKNTVSSIADKNLSLKIYEGSFYDCRGGWVRQKEHYPNILLGSKEDKSIILRVQNN